MAKPTIPEPGDRLGRFTLIEPLGKGAAAVVYRAVDELLDAPICVKVVHPMIARDPEVLTRIKREVLLSRRIAHKNVCRVHDLHEDKGLTFISMDFIDGVGLDEAIREAPGRMLDVATSLNIVADVAEGVAAAHRENIVHRDLKPQNIMVRRDSGEAVILDFGVAFSAEMSNLTRPGVALGTLHWISPEVWRGESPTARSDIYALGVILYNCLTGRAPLASKSMTERLVAMEKGMPLPSRRVPGLPAAVDELFRKSTAFDQAERLADADDFARMARATAMTLDFDNEMTAVAKTQPDITAPPSGPLPNEAGFEDSTAPSEPQRKQRDEVGVYIGRSERVTKLATDPDAQRARQLELEQAPTRIAPMPVETGVPSAERAFAVDPVIEVDLPLTEDLQPGEGSDDPSVDDVALPSDQSFVLSGEAQERLRTRMFSRDEAADDGEMIGAAAPSKPRALAARYPAVAASLVGIAGALTAAVVYFGLQGDLAVVGFLGDGGAVADAGALVAVVDDLPPEPEPEPNQQPSLDASATPGPASPEQASADAGEVPAEGVEAEAEVDAGPPSEPPVPRSPTAGSVEPEPEPEPAPQVASRSRRRQQARARRRRARDTGMGDYAQAMEAYRRALGARGLLAADVPGAARDASAARRAAKRNAYKSAASYAAAATAKVKAQPVNRAFIERKLARFNKAYDRAKDERIKQALRPVMGDVLKKLTSGQYASANKALNRAFKTLD